MLLQPDYPVLAGAFPCPRTQVHKPRATMGRIAQAGQCFLFSLGLNQSIRHFGTSPRRQPTPVLPHPPIAGGWRIHQGKDGQHCHAGPSRMKEPQQIVNRFGVGRGLGQWPCVRDANDPISPLHRTVSAGHRLTAWLNARPLGSRLVRELDVEQRTARMTNVVTRQATSSLDAGLTHRTTV